MTTKRAPERTEQGGASAEWFSLRYLHVRQAKSLNLVKQSTVADMKTMRGSAPVPAILVERFAYDLGFKTLRGLSNLFFQGGLRLLSAAVCLWCSGAILQIFEQRCGILSMGLSFSNGFCAVSWPWIFPARPSENLAKANPLERIEPEASRGFWTLGEKFSI